MRFRRVAAAFIAAVSAISVALIAAPPAAADAVTVAFVDRLGCGTSDDTRTPVFSWSGAGIAGNGSSYAATTEASSYPATSGVFSAVSGETPYATYVPVGYGSDFQYRATTGLGFPNIVAGRAATLTMTLPHAQAIQFTVGGVQAPTQLLISGSGPAGSVSANGAARSTTPGSATTAPVGASVRVTAGPDDGGPDEQPRNAADIWFAQPVSEVTLTLTGVGGGVDSGFIVTAPIACQAGSVTTTAVVSSPAVNAGAGSVEHTVELTTTITNTSPSTGAALYPSVSAPLAAALSAQGIALGAVSQVSASDPACALTAAADGSGPLISPGAGFLAPAASCTLVWSAEVSMPQSSVDRTATLSSVLGSAASSAGRTKSSTSAPLTFPGLSSELSVTESGATQTTAGASLPHTATVTNRGPGTALASTATITIPDGLTFGPVPAGCSFAAPTLSCPIGNLAPGGSVEIAYSVIIPAGVPSGSSYPLNTTVSTTSQTTPATSSATITVTVPPPPPQPPSVAPAPPVQRPAPLRSPNSATTRIPAVPSQLPPVVAPPPAPLPAPEPASAEALPMNLRFAAARITPGTVAAMRGTLGPNVSEQDVTVTFTGRVGKGMIYRTVAVSINDRPGDPCEVLTSEFSCIVTLLPGESARDRNPLVRRHLERARHCDPATGGRL